MENIIIIIIVVIAISGGVISSVRHFKGKGGCCGGGGSYRTKKKLSNIIEKKTFQVEGMHCEHCRNRVEEAVNDIKGVSGKVNLKERTLTVSYAEKVSDDIIISRVEKAGYKIK
ncbi:MAG: cation transporter [Clostridium sp.]|nr:cation transporter [Clostridium sp.]MCM1171602.1 cation transporter [Clostridium sp.]MCM1207583.1 cation transporter [Ruminococcus sp.]